MFLKKIQKLIILVFILVPFVVITPQDITADHRLSVSDCEEFLRDESEVEIERCKGHALVDQQVQSCIDDEAAGAISEVAYQGCINNIEPAFGYTARQAEELILNPGGSGDDDDDDDDSSVGPVGDQYTITPPEFVDDQNPIYTRLNQVINFLSVGIILVITGSVIVTSIQFAAARDNPQAAGEMAKRLTSAGIALILYVFGWALLNWLVPGGVFG